MKKGKFTPAATLFMGLVITLAAVGVVYGLWFKILTIRGIVHTGMVDAALRGAFTDDDDYVDMPDIDGMDTGDCRISVGPDTAPDGFPNKDPNDKITSCDPSETGKDPKAHYDKDVARCDAHVVTDATGQAPMHGEVVITNGYPSYHCTAWFQVWNRGTIPVKIAKAEVNGQPVRPSHPTPFDLTDDDKPDLEIHLTDIDICQQIDPGEAVWMNVDQHVLQPAPQGSTFGYGIVIQLNQWNEPGENCLDRIIDADGIATATDGLPAAQEVSNGDPLTSFPAPGTSGLDMFDNDMNGQWTWGPAGDDLHSEGTGTCPTASRDGDHDLGADCKVLDWDGGLANGQFVTCDLEFMIPDPVGGAPGSVCPTNIKFHDLNGNGQWDSGEDLVLDTDNDGVFDA